MKSVYERELMAIVLAVHKWRPYLLGRRFTVITDQRSLKYLLEQRIVPWEHQKWVSKLSWYDFEIRYRPGKENGAADALSRRVSSIGLFELAVSTVALPEHLLQAVKEDQEMIDMQERIGTGGDGIEGFSVVDGLVRYQGSPGVTKGFRGTAADR